MNQVIFDKENHTYQRDGIFFPSCTEVVNFILNNSKNYSNKSAMEFGTAVHECLFLILQGYKIEMHPRVALCVKQFFKWAIDNDIEVSNLIFQKHSIASNGYGWEIDLYYPPKHLLIDIKTGGVYDEPHYFQLMGYSQAIIETEWIAYKDRFPLMLNLYLGEIDYKEVSRIYSREKWLVFISACHVLNYNKKLFMEAKNVATD